MRLFVGLFPPEDVLLELRELLTRALGGAGRRVRLTPVERWHLTLAFLGEVDPGRLGDVGRALDGVPAAGPITLRMSGGGSFGRGRSSVLWAGVDGDLAGLVALQAGIREALEEHGLPHDTRPFTPHLTVAYATSPDVRAALTDHAGPTWTAQDFVLVHSRHTEGAGYEILRSWPCS